MSPVPTFPDDTGNTRGVSFVGPSTLAFVIFIANALAPDCFRVAPSLPSNNSVVPENLSASDSTHMLVSSLRPINFVAALPQIISLDNMFFKHW